MDDWSGLPDPKSDAVPSIVRMTASHGIRAKKKTNRRMTMELDCTIPATRLGFSLSDIRPAARLPTNMPSPARTISQESAPAGNPVTSVSSGSI